MQLVTWTRKKIFLIILSVVVLVPVYIYISNPLVVTVNGAGEVEAKPDSSTVAFSVVSSNATAKEAKEAVETKATALEGMLNAFGADGSDIVKSQPTITPLTTSVGYNAMISMGVKIPNPGETGSLINSLYSNGAYYVSQAVLSSEDAEGLEDDAYKKALSDAGGKINTIAWRNKKLFRKKVSVIESYSTGGSSSYTSPQQAEESSGESAESGFDVPSADSITVSKIVTVTYMMW